MSASSMGETRDTSQSSKAAASGWIGSALEYYDFFIYATAASLVFPQIFFPSENPRVAIIASLATYGVGYVARPIGAFVLGHWGDTHGRKNVLILCMFLMGISTLLVGLLPTYQQVGILAPILLVILRLVQGFAVAGEISGASSMVLEHAPFGRRGFFASFTLQGVQAGQILAAAVFLPLAHFMPDDAFNSWGWRIPFLLSFVVIIAGWIIRREVQETPAFQKEEASHTKPKSPVIEAIQTGWPDMIRVICMALMNTIPVVATVFGAAYAVQAAYGVGFHKDVYLWIPVMGNILACLVIPALYWWFGISAVNASFTDVVAYFVPYFVAVMIALNWTTGGKIIPIMNDVSQVLTMFEINRAVFAGLLRPEGQKFKVTAKGGERSRRIVQWVMMRRFGALMLMTVGGMVYAMLSDYAPDGGAGDGKLVILFWSFYNLIVLMLAMTVCIELPRLRGDERYPTDEQVEMELSGDMIPARLIDISLGGARIQGTVPTDAGEGFLLHLAEVGVMPVTVVNARDGAFVVKFLHDAETRDRMIRKIYSDNYQLNVSRVNWRGLLAGLGSRAAQ